MSEALLVRLLGDGQPHRLSDLERQLRKERRARGLPAGNPWHYLDKLLRKGFVQRVGHGQYVLTLPDLAEARPAPAGPSTDKPEGEASPNPSRSADRGVS